MNVAQSWTLAGCTCLVIHSSRFICQTNRIHTLFIRNSSAEEPFAVPHVRSKSPIYFQTNTPVLPIKSPISACRSPWPIKRSHIFQVHVYNPSSEKKMEPVVVAASISSSFSMLEKKREFTWVFATTCDGPCNLYFTSTETKLRAIHQEFFSYSFAAKGC